MDFNLTWQQRAPSQELDKYLKKEIAPQVADYDRKKILRDPIRLKEVFQKVRPFGAISGVIPEQYGGLECDYISTGLIFQKLAEHWGALWGTCLIQIVVARILLELEDDEIKNRYLPDVCQGNRIGCTCITEPNTGSNPADLKTTITKIDKGYRLNGVKTWISNGSVSDLALVVATCDQNLGSKGLGIVLVDRRESPYETRELEKMGLKSFPTSEVFFDDVFVPEQNLVIKPGGGMRTIGRAFELARGLMACGSVGFAQAALATAVKYAKEREQWGKKIGSHQLIQKLIYNMKARTDSAYLLTMRALWMMDSDIRCEAESSLAKAYATEAGVLTTRECIQIMGGYGLSEEYHAERLYRDASMMSIPDGTTQIQELIVARSLLGLQAFA